MVLQSSEDHNYKRFPLEQMDVVSQDLRNREIEVYKKFREFVVQNRKFLSSLKKRRKNTLLDSEERRPPAVSTIGVRDSKHAAVIIP